MKNNNTKLKKLGFTLIELLAIIVILAIIAVITVPIILNVIDNAKKGTAKDSAYGYKDAISKYYVSGMLEEEKINLNSTYNVVDGKLGEYDIPFSGTKPTSGYLTFENNILTTGCLTIDGYKVTFANGEVENVVEGQCEEITQEPEVPEITYKCKRATTLHTEECYHPSATSSYCVGDGYIEGNKGTTITYGNPTITKGVLTSGDAFDCDVNGDGEYNSETERFYYVSDLYNTTTKQFDNSYAVLIYYKSTYGQQSNTSGIAYNTEGINYNGPVTAKTYLPTKESWKNVSLSNTSRAILDLNGNNSITLYNGTYNLITNFDYSNYAARLITLQELYDAFKVDSYNQINLKNLNYFLEQTHYSNQASYVDGFWLETVGTSSTGSVGVVSSNIVTFYVGAISNTGRVRPVIEVLKTDIEI